MTVTETRLRIRRVDDIPETARICHYDELDEHAKERFPVYAEICAETIDVDHETAAGFDGCELVKFTDYFRIERE